MLKCDRIQNKDIIFRNLLVEIMLFWGIYSVAFNYFTYTAGIVGTFIYTLVFLQSGNMEKYLLVLFALPFASIYKISPEFPSSIIILYGIYIAYKFADKKKFSPLYAGLLVVLMVLQILTIILYDANISSIVSFFLNIIFAWSCIEFFETEHNKKVIFEYLGITFAVSVAFNIFIADYFPSLAYVISYDNQITLDSIGRFSALNGDPNYFSQLVLISIALLLPILWVLIKRGNKYKSLLISIIILYLAINGYRSLSKSYVITLAILILLIGYFVFINQFNKKISIIFAPLIIFIIGVCLISVIYQLILPTLELRANSTGLLTGRAEIWMNYFKLFKAEPLIIFLGSGFSNGMNELARHSGTASVAHNIYIELVADIGLLGVGVLFAFWSKAFKRTKVLFNNEMSLFLWMFLVTSFGLSLSSFDALYVILPIIMLIDLDKKEVM